MIGIVFLAILLPMFFPKSEHTITIFHIPSVLSSGSIFARYGHSLRLALSSAHSTAGRSVTAIRT
jgi:hypothetical protein